MDTRAGLTPDEQSDLKEVFDMFDVTGTGLINAQELVSALSCLGFEKRNPTAFSIVKDLAGQKATSIDFNEFLDAICARLGDRETPQGLRRLFNLFDYEGRGAISFKNLRKVCDEIGENIADEELNEMILRASGSGQPEISFDDFCKVMQQRITPARL